MDAAYDAAQWNNFALAVAPSAAALVGLLGVAISLNIREILADADLPGRAGSALIMLTIPLVTAVFLLVPAQSDEVLGLELLLLGVSAGGVLVVLVGPWSRSAGQSVAQWAGSSGVPVLVLVVSTILAGVGSLTGSLGALFWLVPAVVAAVFGGLVGAWVLLVEILR